MRRKGELRGTMKESYKKMFRFKDEVSYNKYKAINCAFIKYMMRLVSEGHYVVLPGRMGSVQVVGKKENLRIVNGKIEGLAPDWVATKKFREENPDTDKIIYHTNNESDGVRYKIKWSRMGSLCKNKKRYMLIFSRGNKRYISSLIKNKKVEYEVHDRVYGRK